jgi:alpha-beta hydrolase superfamily lysophospholipase
MREYPATPADGFPSTPARSLSCCLIGSRKQMSADPRVESLRAPTYCLAEALYFDSGDRRLFGWLHGASRDANSGVGLVICPPFGYEAISSHRAVRVVAELAATLGVPALRFDYSGTGDSLDIESHVDQMDLWSQDVLAAVGELQRRTGVQSVCLVGFRFGALLATLAASQCKDVKALILIAPVISGLRYLRELHRTQLAGSLSAEAAQPASSAAVHSPSTDPGSMEIGGFLLSAATVATLPKVELTTLGLAVTDILVIDRVELPAARAWSDGLSGNEVRLEYLSLPGLVGMLMTDPQFAVISQPLIVAVREWLLRLRHAVSARSEAVGVRRPDFGTIASTPVLRLPGNEFASRALLSERPEFFGSQALLFGIVTEPPQSEIRHRAVILLNAGADNHIGANRMHVSLARSWARRGYIVLRMDLAGLGDSGTLSEQAEDDAFPPSALEDIREAIAFMCGRYAVGDITLVGLCAGAYHALRAAVERLPVNRILMVNPQNYFPEPRNAENDLPAADIVRNRGVYRERVFSTRAWKRLISSDVSIRRIIRIYIRSTLMVVESTIRDLARRLDIRLRQDLGRDLEEVVARGVRVVFVFARGEPGIDLLRIQGGSSVKGLGEDCRVIIINSGDHTFSHSSARTALENVLSEELFARNEIEP